MGHGKETPRQQMIGLMYLFLTCMLALNVSKDVLDSFVLVSESLERTVSNYKTKNQKVYDEFEKQLTINENKVRPWKEKADSFKTLTDSLYNLIESYKIGFLTLAENSNVENVIKGDRYVIDSMNSKDNIDFGGQYFILEGRGEILRGKINEYREAALALIPESEVSIVDGIKGTLNTDTHTDGEGAVHTWEARTFEHIPAVADIVMLEKLKTDIKNVETDVINYLFKQISAGDFKFNALSATVIANSNYVMRGSDYSATVFLAAFDSTQAPEILVGSYKKKGPEEYEMVGAYETLKVEGGRGIYKKLASSLGERKWGGLIRITRPDGTVSCYPFEESYQVAEPSLVISPTKMNVFYYGIDNPVSISVPGVPSNKLKVSVPGGGATIKAAGNGYMVKPTQRSGTVKIAVAAEINGKVQNMGSMEFRLKTIPTPKAKVMGKESGQINKSVLSSAPGVTAVLEDFAFDLKYKVTKYTVTTTINGMTTEKQKKGSEFDAEIRNLIKNLKANSKLIIEDIEAVGPDGTPRALSPIVFKVK
ncbi:MAG: gliding motility protein GldM [Salinivirgaceae bacterium]|nr:gliding motility protein GldM [Salinivirgaceae bacterium]